MFGVSRHADLLAVSFASGQDVEDPYFDVLTAAEYNWAGYTFMKGCGNDTTWEADCARSTICVGGYEHTPTGIHLFWGAYDNPSGTDRELPHLVARAGGEESEFIVSTVNDPMNTFTTAHPEAEGTSLAAPVITGMAAFAQRQ